MMQIACITNLEYNEKYGISVVLQGGCAMKKDCKFKILLLLLCMGLCGCSDTSTQLETQEITEVVPSEEEENTEITLPEEPREATYPFVTTVSFVEDIDVAIYSEGTYCVYADDKVGYVQEEGDTIAPCIYEQGYPFSEGLACVYKDGKFGYIDNEGKEVLPFCYEAATPFVEGLAYFCVDGKYGYLDKTGAVTIEPVYDDAGYFRNGVATVRIGTEENFIDTTGKEVIPQEPEEYVYQEWQEAYKERYEWVKTLEEF